MNTIYWNISQESRFNQFYNQPIHQSYEEQVRQNVEAKMAQESERLAQVRETWIDWTSLSKLMKSHPEVSNMWKVVGLLFNLDLFDVDYDAWRRFCEIDDSLNSNSSWWYYNWDTWRLYEYNHADYDAGHIENWQVAEDLAVWRTELPLWTSIFRMWNWDIVWCVSMPPEIFWMESARDVKMADVYTALKIFCRESWLPFYNTTIPIAVPSQYNEGKTTLEVDIIEPDTTREEFHQRIKTVLKESSLPLEQRTPWNDGRATRLMRDYMNSVPRSAQRLWWKFTEKFLAKDMYKIFWNVQMSMLNRPDWQEGYLVTARMSFQDVAFGIVRTPQGIKVTIRMPEQSWPALSRIMEIIHNNINIIIDQKYWGQNPN